MSEVKQIPLRPGLWTTPAPGEKPQLIGSRCRSCGEVFFPKRDKGMCANCGKKDVEDIKLSRRGKLYSFTTVMQRQPIYYKSEEVPYTLAWVELPEGVRFESLLTGVGDPEALKIGTEVELVIEKLHTDEQGNEVVTYKFKPVKALLDDLGLPVAGFNALRKSLFLNELAEVDTQRIQRCLEDHLLK